MIRLGVIAVIVLLFSGCRDNQPEYEIPVTATGFSLPDSIRKMSEKAKKESILGRMLFFDPIVSRDSSLSCGSCHLPAAAFGDRLPVSIGVQKRLSGVRNTPPLFNLFWRSSFFKDGGIPRLEQVAIAPMQSHKELDLPLEQLSLRLQQHPGYVKRFEQVYQQLPDPYTITRSLAWFQRSLVSGSSPYDHWLAGDSSALSQEARQGFSLFISNGCAQCHTGLAFSDDRYYHIGLPTEGIDYGRSQISIKWEDYGKFRVPTLRNLSFTPPYMHDGSIPTLDSVVSYYVRGGSGHPLQDKKIKAFQLSDTGKRALISFLEALNDSVFISWPSYQPTPSDYQD